ncbi:hypothetical protein bplSymb_SCF00301P002 [Bathymodiolus platifrons methanotrophic gill symbiont]|uniref:hypothetical protein n=1 Tax=Bathymodiolus platifrons methanotrophic gill symbiont TaxID=113268 RepID=UPI000B6BB985|nr:hypothetical protein [Bathymodiolus platifrons methanotrophic gill symbiont]GAW85046.1 hypothetical protein bplSymb_SCF00301P002 [Bathymodiolus platifrons methanotrophic gill symbiont]
MISQLSNLTNTVLVQSLKNEIQQPPLIAHIIYRLGVGGLENGLINLINQMPADKYRHMIICLKGSTQFSERLKRQDVQIIDLKKKKVRTGGPLLQHIEYLGRIK